MVTAPFAAWAMNERSIFSSSTGSTASCDSVECPVPKSSMAKRSPARRSSCMLRTAICGSRITALSVISSMSADGSTRSARSSRSSASPSSGSRMSAADRFTASSSSSPWRRHSPSWRTAAASTQLVSRREPPVLSASGTNSAGDTGAELRMLPAHQRLETRHRAVRHRHLRLVHERQVVLIDGGAQIGDQGEAAAVLLVLAEAVHGDAGAHLVGIVERHLGALQQLVGAAPVAGEQAYAAGHAQIEADAGQVEAGADHRGELLGVQQGALGGAARGDHQELRFTEPRERVDGGHVLLQPARRLAQHVIAHLVAERGVDVAQVAQLDEHQRRARPRAPRRSTRLSSPRITSARFGSWVSGSW